MKPYSADGTRAQKILDCICNRAAEIGPGACTSCKLPCIWGKRYQEIIEEGEDVGIYTAKEMAQKARELIRAGKSDAEAAVAVGYKNAAALYQGVYYYIHATPHQIRQEAKKSQKLCDARLGEIAISPSTAAVPVEKPPIEVKADLNFNIADFKPLIPTDLDGFEPVTFGEKEALWLYISKLHIKLSLGSIKALGEPKALDLLINRSKKQIALKPGSSFTLSDGRSKRIEVMSVIRETAQIEIGKLHGTKVGNMIIFGE